MASLEEDNATADQKSQLSPPVPPPKTPPGKSHRRNRSDASSSSRGKKRRQRAFSGSGISISHSSTGSGEHEDPTTPKSTRQPSPHIVPYNANVAHSPVYRMPVQYGYYNSGFPPAPPPSLPFPPTLPSRQSMGMSYQRQRVDFEGSYNGPWASGPVRIEGTRMGPKGLNSEYYEQGRQDIPQILISSEDDSEDGQWYSGSDDDQTEDGGSEDKGKGKGKGRAGENESEDIPQPQASQASQQPRRGSPPPSRRTGYPYVAETLTNHPSLALYRRFSTLNHLVLLHLQDEISELESILAELDTAEYLSNAGLGLRSRRVGSGGGAKRIQVMGAVAWKLREYHMALKNFADVADTLEAAREDEIMAYRKWMDSERPLVGPEGRFLESREDLISLRKTPKLDSPVVPTPPPQAAHSQSQPPPPQSQPQSHEDSPPEEPSEPMVEDPKSTAPEPIPKEPLPSPTPTLSLSVKIYATLISLGISAVGGWILEKKSEMQVPAALTIGACGGAMGVMWMFL
ncbi:unnamed protein product [Tuber melanosporum]|uniref:(Perigord truffle) hypothetical protein n=1 Tax=Tuber melanosporum (strain Mel28) TaxID=656061 RepID=D5GGL9_TUBMM|nr:uncharacterized protein GSTUM_00007413001 [Tuber melanosporum]CAZ83641.1 unnamed protein product [Tuber melanosporum]